jgi:hypothetical protein
MSGLFGLRQCRNAEQEDKCKESCFHAANYRLKPPKPQQTIENIAKISLNPVLWQDYNIYMRRLTFISALGMALLASLSLQAQMRGGMGGGRSLGSGPRVSSGFRSSAPRGFAPSGPRGFAPAGPRAFAPAGPRTFAPAGSRAFAPGGFRTFAPAPRSFGSRTFSRSSFGVRTFSPAHRVFRPFPTGFRSFRGFHHRFFRNRFFFSGCFGCVSPFFFSSGLFFDPFISPFYTGFGPDYYAYGPPPPPPVVVTTDNGADAQLAAEVNRLADEVDDLRYEQSRSSSDNRSSSEPKASVSVMEPVTNVSFIFRDGRQITARNYAIAGETLWVLDEHAAKKFALADVDIPATEKANAVNGVEIHFPAMK